MKNTLPKFTKSHIVLTIWLLVLLFNCSSSDNSNTDNNRGVIVIEEEITAPIYTLNLRVHLMKDIIMTHATSGLSMESWVTPLMVTETIMPEVNAIWKQANIVWKIDSIIEEDVVKSNDYEASIAFIVSTARDEDGNSDSDRLPHLFSLMQPQNRSTESQVDTNLFHIYLFPFIGNTSQGNAMSKFNYHSVVGTWTNKFNKGGVPEETLLIENHSSFDRGSLSRTISHEVGHVLQLKHDECLVKCLMGGINSDGYTLSENQISTARKEALRRLLN